MKIHLVTVDSGWILQRLANECAAYCGYTVSTEPRDDVDVNYYFDFQNAFKGRAGSGKQVAFFTHFHEDSADYVKNNYRDLLKQLDGIVFMNRRYEARMEDICMMHGIKARMTRLRPGDPMRHFKPKKKRIGIFQRGGTGGPHEPNTGYPGKGHDFMLQMVRDYTATMQKFEWNFVGQGWRNVVNAMDQQKIKVFWFGEDSLECHTQQEIRERYSARIHDVDYVLVPSLWEGGPMIIPQALACGVEVISANVGWADEFPFVDLFPAGDHAALSLTLEGIPSGTQAQRFVEEINWATYKEGLEEFCADL